MTLFKTLWLLSLLFNTANASSIAIEDQINGTYALSRENSSKGCMRRFVVGYRPLAHKFVLGEIIEEEEVIPFEKYIFRNVNTGKQLSHLSTRMGLVATWEENKLIGGEKIIFSSHQTGRKTGVEFRKVTLVFFDGTMEMVDTRSASGLCLYELAVKPNGHDASLYYLPRGRWLEYL